jgi:hypothetical protein
MAHHEAIMALPTIVAPALGQNGSSGRIIPRSRTTAAHSTPDFSAARVRAAAELTTDVSKWNCVDQALNNQIVAISALRKAKECQLSGSLYGNEAH